ncbi:MAG: class I SAM-dependent methyltransferase [Gallionella sp.]|nr:class I SAM-dependent methyltransferase [Gallionella sp.]
MLKRGMADLIVPIADFILAPMVLVAAVLMKIVRRFGIWRMPVSKAIFNRVGIYPIRDHYYEPMYNYKKHLQHSLRDERSLPGMDMNEAGQLCWLEQFNYAAELERIPLNPSADGSFYYKNPNFSEGDAECLYSLIRLKKPRRIIEIGSGFSTMMAREAIAQNKREDAAYSCIHTCIEPYEMGWLEGVPGLEVVRQRVEEVDIALFKELTADDILFIDSSHVIRPQSDVLTECLEILPILNVGVLIHIHDIFTPYDYLDHWLIDEVKLWNEQYLLEAFLSCNTQFEIVLALNFLSHRHPAVLEDKFPMLRGQAAQIEPRSFWIRKAA